MGREDRVAVVGAGPYGLACAAFLRHAGVRTRVFGGPMAYWAEHMPRGMLLRSRRRSSHIADPTQSLTIDAYEAATGRLLLEPLGLDGYAEYGRWFQQRTVPDADPRLVDRIDRTDGGFGLTLDDGEMVSADRVVVAAGLGPFAWKPAPFGGLSPDLVTHTSERAELAALAGKHVLVIGAGQSALESAALLHESGADVEVVAKTRHIFWLPGDSVPGIRARVRRMMLPPTDVGGRLTGWMAAAPDLFRRLPVTVQEEVAHRCTVPAGASWLPLRLGEVPVTLGRTAVDAAAVGSGGVRIMLDDGTAKEADHVLLGTGFRVNVAKYPFLPAELSGELDRVAGYPRLGPGLESSLEGVHFVGAPAALSFGPLMRFVVGTWYAGPALARAVLGRRQRAIRPSYKPRVAVPRRADLT